MTDPSVATQIRAAVFELVDAAPPAPPLPQMEPTALAQPRPRRRRLTIGVTIGLVVALVVTGAVVVSERADDDARVVTAKLPPATVLTCRTTIGQGTDPSRRRTIVLGRVALTTRHALQANSSGESDPAARLFAKDGLEVKEHSPVELIVPRPWRDRLSISWGNTARTTHLRVRSCPGGTGRVERSGGFGPHLPWMAWAGGYSVSKPACVPLIVKVGEKTRRVHIGVGAPCPGQRPPPP